MGVAGSCGGCSFLQVSNDPASFSYVVPPGGPWTVTSWSARGGSMVDSARLLVFRPTSTPGQYQLVANSADAVIDPVAAPAIPVSIPVQPGDRLGDVFGGVMGNLMLGQTAGPGGTYLIGLNSFDLANVSATLTAPHPAPTAKKKCKKKKCKKRKRKRKKKR